jgi:hypothetical protein
MITLRIYDYRNGVLALDLRDLVDLLAPRSLEADWKVSPVTLNDPHLGRSFDEFMVTGPTEPGQVDLKRLAASALVVSGVTLSELHTRRIRLSGANSSGNQKDPWVVMCAIDSTFYEVTSEDQVVLNAIRSAYKDVRVAPGPVKSIPIERV